MDSLRWAVFSILKLKTGVQVSLWESGKLMSALIQINYVDVNIFTMIIDIFT